MIYSAGPCSVCAGAGNACFVRSLDSGRIFFACSSCGLALGALDSVTPWRFSAVWMRTGTDAVVSMLNYSEMRRNGGTNVEGLMAQAEYRAAPQLVLSARHHVGSYVNAPLGDADHVVHRLQLSASAGF